METQEQHGKFLLTGISTVIIIVFVVLIGIAVIVLRARNAQQTSSVTQMIQPSPYIALGNGEFNLQSTTGQTVFSVGDTMTVDVFMNSDGNPVTAYDVELLFGPEVSFVSETSLLPSFGMSSSKKDGGVYITGYKKIGNEQNGVFSKTSVARLTFKMMKPGKALLSPQFIPGKKIHSNIITTENMNILGKVGGITITIQ